MAMSTKQWDERKINGMVKELKNVIFFYGPQAAFPSRFYQFSKEEQKEIIKRYRAEAGIN